MTKKEYLKKYIEAMAVVEEAMGSRDEALRSVLSIMIAEIMPLFREVAELSENEEKAIEHACSIDDTWAIYEVMEAVTL